MKRIEKDLLGNLEIDNKNYYGVHTQRAINNFNLTGDKISSFPSLIEALAKVKKVSALNNFDLGLLPSKLKDAICHACDNVIAGKYHDQFIVDPIQGGAGTSVNMNANEVLANIALEFLGHKKGNYSILHPLDHVNLSQSTNDVYPSAVKISISKSLDNLYLEMANLRDSFKAKAEENKNISKIGRTQLQDAVPMTFKQAFDNYGNQINNSINTIKSAQKSIYGLNLGATAIGNGIASPKNYSKHIEKHIKSTIGDDFYNLEDLFVGTQDASCFAIVSGSLRSFALQLSKIANDLRLMSSGPRAGLAEITLPPKQAGSSIMPGKVNPVIAEAINQVCYQIIGFDSAIAFCVEGGQLELNAFEPLICYNLLFGIQLLKRSLKMLVQECIVDIKVNHEKCREDVVNSISLAAIFNPYLGYELTTKIAKQAVLENKTIMAVVLDLKLMDEKKLQNILQESGIL